MTFKYNLLKKKEKKSVFFFSNEKDYFAENLSMLLSAGIGVSSAISIMSEGAKGISYKNVLSEIIRELDEGNPLWKSMDGRRIFNASYIYMTKIGEASGRLPENLAIIAKQDKKNKSLNSKLVSALIYPGVILSLTLVIGIGVTVFVIPSMAKIFSGMRIELPIPTQILINIGNFIIQHTFTFFLLIVIFLIVIVIIFFVPKTKKIGQAILFRVPIVRNLYKEVEIARFSYILYSLIDAGMPLNEAILSIEQSTALAGYRKFYHFLAQSINDGNSLGRSFQKYKNLDKILPVNIQQMIIAGENSGNFTNTLGKISEIYEEKIDTSSKNISVILEPILLILVALAVLFLALSVVLPIYGLVGGLNA
jgi:type II secretory pathway component PulF